jgi:ABC-type branched-subunit amino acid transport system substrate-binding protein
VRKLTSVAVILAACVLLFAVGCTKKEAKEIRVGVVEAQSGMFASFGQSGGFGVQAAVDDINKQGGVQVGSEKIPIKLRQPRGKPDHPEQCPIHRQRR